MQLPELDEICGQCGHEYKFHVDILLDAQACDFGEHEETVLCGCPLFVQVADPGESVGVSRCEICGEEGGGHGPGCVLNDEDVV